MSSRFLQRCLPLLLVLNGLLVSPAYAGQQEGASLSPDRVATERTIAGANRPGATPFARTELFFGTSRPDGQEPVSDEEFRWFLDNEITPRFPDGLTLVSALGQFRNASGVIIQEQSLVLILLYPAENQRVSSRRIERIRTAYKNYFQQESVLRVDDPSIVWVSF
ncbi:MAG: DUF3574 domain-containing protein [Luteitalea sp.]|nr:DUF3574 domain-containing protein [Luteitalea sp.]